MKTTPKKKAPKTTVKKSDLLTELERTARKLEEKRKDLKRKDNEISKMRKKMEEKEKEGQKLRDRIKGQLEKEREAHREIQELREKLKKTEDVKQVFKEQKIENYKKCENLEKKSPRSKEENQRE